MEASPGHRPKAHPNSQPASDESPSHRSFRPFEPALSAPNTAPVAPSAMPASVVPVAALHTPRAAHEPLHASDTRAPPFHRSPVSQAPFKQDDSATTTPVPPLSHTNPSRAARQGAAALPPGHSTPSRAVLPSSRASSGRPHPSKLHSAPKPSAHSRPTPSKLYSASKHATHSPSIDLNGGPWIWANHRLISLD